MSLTDLFAHTFDIYSLVGGADDAYGEKQAVWTLETSGQKGRFELHNAWEEKFGRLVTVGRWRMYCGPTTPLTLQKRIYWTDQAMWFEITGLEPVANRTVTHHKYVRLEVVE